MVKAGDILKFAEPLHSWDKKFLDKGGKYIVSQNPKTDFYQDENGWWHCKDLEETELRVELRISNGGLGCGKVSDFADRKFEVVGNIFENGE